MLSKAELKEIQVGEVDFRRFIELVREFEQVKQRFYRQGYIKEVKPFGKSGHIILPKDLVYKKVIVIVR